MLGIQQIILGATLLAISSVNSHPSQRLINGEVAVPHSFPYIVFLDLHFVDDYPQFFCNGILISSNFVLTTAYCLDQHAGIGDFVILGAQNQSNVFELSQVRKTVKNFTRHPDHEFGDNAENNIGIIELDSPVDFTDAIQPAKLVDDVTQTYENKIAKIAGWGGDRKEPSGKLHFYEDIIVSQDDCMKNGNGYVALYNYTICPSGNDNKSLGRWDDGAPLEIDGEVIAFATFWISPFGQVFTRIDNFLPWIRNITDIEI